VQVAFAYGVLGKGALGRLRPGQEIPQLAVEDGRVTDRWMEVLRDPEMLQCYAQEVVEEAYEANQAWLETRTDELTGLPNRRRWLEDLWHAYRWINTYDGDQGDEATERGLALSFIDLDNFKAVNDAFGHEVGNSILRLFADMFNAISRGQGSGSAAADLAGRPHGDEFVCNSRLYRVVSTSSPDSKAGEKKSLEQEDRRGAGEKKSLEQMAEAIGERLQESINQKIDKINAYLRELGRAKGLEYEVQIGATVGTALLKRGGRIEDFLDEADRAMYEIKQHRASKANAEGWGMFTPEERGNLIRAAEALGKVPRHRRLAVALGDLIAAGRSSEGQSAEAK
jgi:diguanylate cyclase (GGDEF)-like protein